MNGRFSVGLALECTAAPNNQAVAIEWCGGRGFWTFSGFRGYARNLRLPARMGPDDVFVLRVLAAMPLQISVTVHADGAETDDIAIETAAADSPAETTCADPAAPPGSPQAEDILANGYFAAPAKRSEPLFRIRSLRAFPEGAVLHIPLRRASGEPGAENLLIRASVGEQRRLIIIPAKSLEAVASFRLKPEAAGELWPVTIHAPEALEWSAVARRGFDPVILPVFSLERA